jgi:hypothetical protein
VIKRGISGVTVVRNAVRLGYPLYFSVKSVIDACDEFLISEGFSEDSTMDVVHQLQKEYPKKVRVIRETWKPSKAGETVAEVTNNAIERCDFEWIYYVQADEIVHEDNLRFIASVPERFHRYRSVSFRFTHFRLSLLFEMLGSYSHAIRMVRNYSRPWRRNVRRLWYRSPLGRVLKGYYSIDPVTSFMDAYSAGDGWTFTGHIWPVLHADFLKPVFHVGYVNKDMGVLADRIESHGRLLYPTLTSYPQVAKAIRAGKKIESWRAQGLKIVPYQRGDYPKLLLDWAAKDGIEHVN